MNSRMEQILLDKMKSLTPKQLSEVEDFIDFFPTRDADHALSRTAASTSTAAFSRIWNNDEDAVYDRI